MTLPIKKVIIFFMFLKGFSENSWYFFIIRLLSNMQQVNLLKKHKHIQ